MKVNKIQKRATNAPTQKTGTDYTGDSLPPIPEECLPPIPEESLPLYRRNVYQVERDFKERCLVQN